MKIEIMPRNWSEFQHYKDRSPPWIKLHRSILTDYEFACLPLAIRGLAAMLWVIASESKNGLIAMSSDALAFRLHVASSELIENLKPLIAAGFFIDASGVLAECLQHARPEREREGETEAEEEDSLRSSLSSDKPTAETVEQRIAELTEQAVEAYNATMTGLSKVALVNEVRRKQVKRCLKTARAICEAMFGSRTIRQEFWPSYFAACQEDDFCAGRISGGRDHANWRPDFAYLTRPDVMTRIFDRASAAA